MQLSVIGIRKALLPLDGTPVYARLGCHGAIEVDRESGSGDIASTRIDCVRSRGDGAHRDVGRADERGLEPHGALRNLVCDWVNQLIAALGSGYGKLLTDGEPRHAGVVIR